MAIVKFISDQDCHIFIDKENVGKVTADSLLKAVLEVGGYLIEVKDDEGRILKKYNLEIKTTDNQILQDVSGTSPSTDEVLNLLKNDPTLVFHCGRAKFCLDGKYGYVNKKFEVVIPAIYSFANDFVNNKAFVVRDFPEGRKTTMIDEDGNMFFNRWFDYIGEGDDIILLGIDNRIIVYSKAKCDKVGEYFNAGYDKKASLVPVYKKVGDYNFYGYIDFDGKEAIPFIFNNVGNFDEKGEAIVSFLGKNVKIDISGYSRHVKDNIYDWGEWNDNLLGLEGILEEDLGPTPWCYSPGEIDWDFIPIWNNYKWIIRVSINKVGPRKEIKTFDFNSDYILKIGKGYTISKQADKVLVLIANIYNNGVDEFTFDADDVVPVFDTNENLQGDDIITSRTFIIKKDGKFGVYDTSGKELIPVKYDEIIPFEPYVFAIKKGLKYGVYYSGHLSAIKYDNICKHKNSNHVYCGLLIEKSGKFGLWKKNSVISPLYDYIESCSGYSIDRNIVSLNGKYGVIDDEQKEILPIDYEMIIPLGESYFKVKTNNGWSLGYIHHGIIYPDIYDDIAFISEHEQWLKIFLVKAKDKFGCINNNGELILPINYDTIKLDSSFYTPRVISILTYKDGKVGFCDITYFYSDSYCCKRTGNHDFEYIFYVEPQFDECVLQRNKNSVLGGYYMHYAAVRKDGKWGILDQKPREITYQAIDINIENEHMPNYEDLDFKYESIEDLKTDADNEFKRRYNKYYHPWAIRRNSCGEDCVIKEGGKE